MSPPIDPVPDESTSQPARRRPSGPARRLSDRVLVLAPHSRTGRLLLIFPLLAAAFYLAVSRYLTGSSPYGYDSESLMFDLYSVLPALALAALISLTSRRMAKGMPVVAVGSVLFTGATVLLLLGIITDESSTAVLAILVVPLLLGVLVVIVGLLALLLHALRKRHEHRSHPLPP